MTHPAGDRRSTPSLIGEAVRQAADLVTTELTLVRLEATEKLTLALASIVAIVVAAVFMIVALIFLLQGLVEVLVHAGFAAFTASFIVGGGIAVVAMVAVVVALRNLSGARLKPSRTLGQVRTARDIVKGKA
jgi:hypothetical protein